MAKYYFIDNNCDSEYCHTKKYWQEYMEENNIKSLELFEAKIETDTDYFFCREYGEVGLKSESGCGNLCDHYKPRNGKNGRCINSANCYESTGKKITLNQKH